jgi:YVTN family beta-propeller protein
VTVISDATNTPVASVAVGLYPYGLASDPGTDEIFVANFRSNDVSVISDTSDAVVATTALASAPAGMAFDPGSGEVYVADFGSDRVYAVPERSNTVVRTVAVGSTPLGVTYDGGKGEVFVTNRGSLNVSVIADTNDSVIATVAMGGYPQGTAYDGGTGEVFVARPAARDVAVISDATNTVLTSVSLGAGDGPAALAYDGATGEIFVADYLSDSVSVISDVTNTVVATVAVGAFPDGLAYDAFRGEIFVSNQGSDNVSVISDATNTVVATVTAGSYPAGMAYDSGTGEIVVANALSNDVTVISDVTNTVVATLAVGSGPGDVAYDADNGLIYVSDAYQGTISIIRDDPLSISSFVADPSAVPLGSGTTFHVLASGGVGPLSFRYQALPPGCATSNESSLACSPTLEGTYLVRIVVTDSVAHSVNATTTLSVRIPTWTVTFQETGLLAGTAWSVIVNGASNSSRGSRIAFAEPNGSYAYTVEAVSGYAVSPTSGSGAVLGSNTTVAVAFTPGVPPAPYSVEFGEVGLPAGTSWSVTLNSTEQFSTFGSMAFAEADGTYPFTVGAVGGYSAAPAAGEVRVSGASATQEVAFTSVAPDTFGVTFAETGLPSGTAWSVMWNGSPLESNTGLLMVADRNGTFSFSLGSVPGYASSPSNGVVTVSGVDQTVGVTFTPSSSGTGPFGLPGLLGYAVLGAVLGAAAVAVAIGAAFRRARTRSARDDRTEPALRRL